MTAKKENEDFFVRVTLSPEQARLVVAALDFYSRIRCGQFSELAQVFWRTLDNKRHIADGLLKDLRRLCLPTLTSSDSSFGIAECPDESARVAFDILQVVRQVEALARDPSETRYTVDRSDPHFVSKTSPRPIAKAINILDRLAES